MSDHRPAPDEFPNRSPDAPPRSDSNRQTPASLEYSSSGAVSRFFKGNLAALAFILLSMTFFTWDEDYDFIDSPLFWTLAVLLVATVSLLWIESLPAWWRCGWKLRFEPDGCRFWTSPIAETWIPWKEVQLIRITHSTEDRFHELMLIRKDGKAFSLDAVGSCADIRAWLEATGRWEIAEIV